MVFPLITHPFRCYCRARHSRIPTMLYMLKQITKILLYLVIIIILLDVVLVFGVAKFHGNPKKADAVIVLGAAINSPALYNRTIEGLSLYRQGKSDVLVLSGGRISHRDISEAGYMKKVIEKNANPVPPLILDETSNNTEENIAHAKALIPNAKSVIVVSDEFHLARGAVLALRSGFYPVYVSAPKPDYYKNKELIWYYVREMVAMIAYIPTFIFGT